MDFLKSPFVWGTEPRIRFLGWTGSSSLVSPIGIALKIKYNFLCIYRKLYFITYFTYRRLNFIFNAIPIGETREPYIYINIYIYIYLIYILYCRCLGTRGEALNQNRRILSLFVFTKGIKLGIYDKSSILCLQRSNKLHSNKPQLCSWVYC